MQTVDIGIIVLLALPAIIGVLYGFLNIVFSIVAWVLASAIAVKFGAYFAPMLESLITAVLLQKILAFIAVFIISLMILTGIGFLIMKLLGRTGLTGADRLLGLFFGMQIINRIMKNKDHQKKDIILLRRINRPANELLVKFVDE